MHIRLNRICQGIQPIFNLARLLANGVQRTGVVGSIRSAHAVAGAKAVLAPAAQVVTSGSSDLRHVHC